MSPLGILPRQRAHYPVAQTTGIATSWSTCRTPHKWWTVCLVRRATTTANLSRQRVHPRHVEGTKWANKMEVMKSTGQEKAKEEEKMSVTKAQEGKMKGQVRTKRLGIPCELWVFLPS